jgi:hypothetical protein
MNRVEVLFNSSFDFGKKYVAQAASTVRGGGNGSGGNGGYTVREDGSFDYNM